MRDAVIVDVVRAASGRARPGGALATIHAAELLAMLLESLRAHNDIVAAASVSLPSTATDRQCGSSRQPVRFAAQGVLAGQGGLVANATIIELL